MFTEANVYDEKPINKTVMSHFLEEPYDEIPEGPCKIPFENDFSIQKDY